MAELARLDAGSARRGVAAGLVAGAGGALMIAANDVAGGAGLVLAVLGGVGVVMAAVLWRASAGHVVLTEQGLFDHAGTCLAKLAEIDAVTAAPFAFKPSNGFTLMLNTPQTRLWVPGLYWRYGRRLGIGGVPAGQAARAMAERIAALIAQRQVLDQTT